MNAERGCRLKEERLRIGMPPAEWAVQCGVSRTTQFNYESGERSPDADYLELAGRLGMDVHYVLTGNRPGGLHDDFVLIPAHAVAASAGPGSINGDHDVVGGLCFSRQWLSSRKLSPSHLRVIDVVGESMQPRLNDGDRVLVDISDTLPKSGRAYVLLQGDELLVKYCQLLPEGLLRVSSANPDYPTYDIDLAKNDGVSIVGRVRASSHEW